MHPLLANFRLKQGGRTSLFILFGLATFAAGLVLYYFSASEHRKGDLNNLKHATSLHTSPRVFPNFTLMDHRGQGFTNENLRNSWNFIFFGYTHCPDVCPLTLSTIDQVINNLTAQSKTAVRAVFISVDPQRDTPEQLHEYVQHFNQDMVGLTGSDEELAKLTQALGVVYTSSVDNKNEDYLVDHSAHIFLVAPNGNLAALFSTPHETQIITDDFNILNAHHMTQQGN